MGIRCTQIIGLHDRARDWLEENCIQHVRKEECPNCGHTTKETKSLVRRIYDNSGWLGMFDDGPTLWEYAGKNHEVIREVEQCSPWASGPCIFLCLEKDDGTRLCEWTQEEINDQL